VPTSQQIASARRDLARVPLPVLARKYGCSPVELCAAVRAAGESLEAQPLEIQYLLESFTRVPPTVLRAQLGMSATQFSQLCSRLGLATRQAAGDLTLDVVGERTRWLVETVLSWELDDSLPRRISSQHFIRSGLHNVVAFATEEKEKDTRFRGFPAVAFLLCTAYPGVFQPFQFRHAKANSYFKGRNGKRRYLEAVRWVLEEKLGIRREYLQQAASSKYFLRTADLQFYGLGPHLYVEFFPSKSVLLEELLRYWGHERTSSVATTARLRQTLADSGRPVNGCEVPDCTAAVSAGIEIHHIVPKATRSTRIDLHAADNLVALCPNHHRAARDFPWEARLQEEPETRRSELLTFLTAASRSS
jgi:hypothetical protein